MNPVDAVKSCFRQYAAFSGRARRSEYWFFTLALVVVFLVLSVVLSIVAGAVLGGTSSVNPDGTVSTTGGAGVAVVYGVLGLAYLAVLLPSIAVSVRRLHDIGRTGLWVLLSPVPFGSIVLVVLACLDSQPGANRFGPNPKGLEGAPSGYGQPAQF